MLPTDPDPLLPAPLPGDDAAAEAYRQRWDRLAVAVADPAVAAFVRAGDQAPLLGPLLAAIFSRSPFLSEALLTAPDLAQMASASGLEHAARTILGAIEGLPDADRHRLMAELRRLRVRAALLAALGDLGGRWSLEAVTLFLSEIAAAAISKVTQHLVAELAAQGQLAAGTLSAQSGILILGMGKLGAFELNYSSDVDLIVLFDETRMPYRGPEPPMAIAVRFARGLVHMLEHKTRDGYVFRTDLRLRPHLPGHPLALSTEAAELYYERHGQNWERAAFIKARVVAGDAEAGQRFLAALRPYVWRRHLDFAAIRDIHSIKRQINTHRGFSAIRLLGHDLKLGRGGIREIEFFVQTQQLILGGRYPEVRLRDTCGALEALARGRWVSTAVASELTQAYRLLRALEHRLQMVNDRQTQSLPSLPDEFARFAAFAGYRDAAELAARIIATLETVERHYAALFEAEPDLGLEGSLVFTGTGDHPATLRTLERMGFSDPAAAAARIRDWHHGHIRATRSTRARELLTELMPGLLAALGQARVDQGFRLLDQFLSSLPSGVQIFSLLRANPRLLGLLADLLAAAPRLIPDLARDVSLFEAMLQPDFFDPLPDRAALAAELRRRLGDARNLEDTLDTCRLWSRGRQFQAGVQVISGVADAAAAARALTRIAEIVIEVLLPTASQWLERQHGRIEGGRFALLALGKFGACELTIGSDLDLVFIYDAPAQARSDGQKSLDSATWYARLSQRLVSALSARTAEGRLFDIDMRLRPSGNAGPVACSLTNFRGYQEITAEVWEQQSLCRARVVAGDGDLAGEIDAVLEASIRRERDLAVLGRAVRAMRLRIFKEHGSADPWQVKHARGGILELEFATQFLQLGHARAHPTLRRTGTMQLLEEAGVQGLIGPRTLADLRGSLALQQALQMVLRLAVTARFEPDRAPAGLKEALMRAAARASPDLPPISQFPVLERLLVESQAAVRQFFDGLCPPDQAVTA